MRRRSIVSRKESLQDLKAVTERDNLKIIMKDGKIYLPWERVKAPKDGAGNDESEHNMTPNAGFRATLFLTARSRRVSAVLALAACIALSGCASVGPATVKRDRFDYVVAISDSFKRQTLLNLVKTRYVDVPVYMEINSVINQYAIEGELGFEFAPSASENNLLLGNGKYTDRPTITYSPVTGERFTRNLLTPLPVSSVFLLLQSGYPVDTILRVCVQSINGFENRRSGALVAHEADPRFDEILALMRDLQDAGAIYFQLEPSSSNTEVKVGFKPSESPGAVDKATRLRTLLSLDPKVNGFSVTFGVRTSRSDAISVMTRSMTQIMVEYAADIDVPPEDVTQGRVIPTPGAVKGDDTTDSHLIRVHTGIKPPANPHVAVSYRGQWFWIDDRDLFSKTSLQFLMTLFSFTERGTTAGNAPVITVPTY